MASTVQALTFDVFGTVVNWRSAIIREGRAVHANADWSAIADSWRKLYRPTIDSVTRGERAWATFDELQRVMLEQVLDQYQVRGLAEPQKAHLATVWERLDPWPDVVPGLSRLKESLVVTALSNGSMWQLIRLAKHGHIPWDAIISVELFQAYKPDPRVYHGAANLLQLQTSDVMMVAAHVYDLRAARDNGMKTAFVARANEWGVDSGEGSTQYA